MERYVFDYRKLNGRIHEVFGNRKEFAKSMGISAATLSKKMTNKTYFTQKEIEKAADVLDINRGMINAYFFTREVKNS